MLVLPERDLNDTFLIDSIVFPAMRHAFEVTTDQCPEEVEGARITLRDSVLSAIEVTVINNGYEVSFVMPYFLFKKVEKMFNVREGSCYV